MIGQLLYVLAFFVIFIKADVAENEADHGPSCDCMEYWNCIMSGGTPYSYCGLSDTKVCCFVPEGAKPLGLLPPNHGGMKSHCGKKGIDSGRDGFAEQGEWPWHTAILEHPEDLYICGASLIDESWVLTAAHCVDDYAISNGETLKVRLGEYDVATLRENLKHEERDVADVILHPSFNNQTLIHDIALLKLKRPAKRRPNIDIVCLPKHSTSLINTSKKCFITGWGRKTEFSEHSTVLKEVSVPLWKNSDCQQALQLQFGPSYILPNTSICAGTEGHDACDGDGGGPLVCDEGNQWFQVGIISFGIGCGRRNTPGVYTRVELYEQWIRETVLQFKNQKR